jgi:hypothetical protein
MGKWRYGSIHLNLGIGWEISGRPASRPSRFTTWKSPLYTHTHTHTHTHTQREERESRKQGRQQSASGLLEKTDISPLPRIEPQCLYCRLTARSLITILTEFHSSLLNKIPYTQKMDKIMETLDNIGIKLFVLAALKEHQL